MRAGIPVAAMELMDEVQMRVINLAGTTAKTWKEVPTMFFKYVSSKIIAEIYKYCSLRDILVDFLVLQQGCVILNEMDRVLVLIW